MEKKTVKILFWIVLRNKKGIGILLQIVAKLEVNEKNSSLEKNSVADPSYFDSDPGRTFHLMPLQIRILLYKVRQLSYILPVHHWYSVVGVQAMKLLLYF